MGPDDQVIVIGGDNAVEPQAPAPRSRRPLAVVAVLALGVVIGLVATSNDERPTVADPAGLSAPPEPPAAYVEEVPTTLPNDIPRLALGWKTVRLVGGDWRGSDVTNGPDGWLAVTEGDDIVAHTSDNAVLWTARTVPGLSGRVAHAGVGEGIMAVVMSSADRPGAPATAISTDGGDSWSTHLLDRGGATVGGLRAFGDRLYAFGTAASRSSAEEAPMVWRWSGDGWTSMEDPGAGGLVSDVVSDSAGVITAFGTRNKEAAAWTVGADGLEPAELDLPDGVSSIVEAILQPRGGFLAIGSDEGGGGGGDTLLRSDDLVTWEILHAGSPIRGLAATASGMPVAVSDSFAGLWSLGPAGEQRLTSNGFGAPTGREEMVATAAVAVSGDVVVAAGMSASGESVLGVRGVVAGPVSISAPGGRSWKVVASAPMAQQNAGRFVSVVGLDDDISIIHAGSMMWRLEHSDPLSPVLTELSNDTSAVYPSPDGVWARSSSGFVVITAEDVRPFPAPPVDWIAAVGRVQGEDVVLGYEDDGSLYAFRLVDGVWVAADGPPQPVSDVVALDSGFVGVAYSGEALGTVVSEDGVIWMPVTGSIGGSRAGAPFLTLADRWDVVRLIDRWPDVEELELPTAAPQAVFRHGEGFVVRAPGSVWVGGPIAGWELITAGVEDGVVGPAALVPGDIPTLAALADGELVLLQP